MNRNEITPAIELSIRADKKNHPYWPEHAAAQAGRVCEASGRLMAASMQYKYNSDQTDEVYKKLMEEAAVSTIAMAYRFLENLK
jgi:hypothetical protein